MIPCRDQKQQNALTTFVALAKISVTPEIVGVIGFEPIQTESPDLQSGPALQLRRTPGCLPKTSEKASGKQSVF